MEIEVKTPISIRISLKLLEQIEMLAVQEKRSRNFIINELLEKMVKHHEKRHGKIVVNRYVLENLRSRRYGKGIGRPPKSDSDKRE